jgi:hypothetical protein
MNKYPAPAKPSWASQLKQSSPAGGSIYGQSKLQVPLPKPWFSFGAIPTVGKHSGDSILGKLSLGKLPKIKLNK